MAVKTFLVPSRMAESAERELNSFLAGRRVVGMQKEFVAAGENSFWSILVEYSPQPEDKARMQNSGPRIDYREVLAPEVFLRYSRLREIRKQSAETKGIPVFSIFSNEQLAILAAQESLDIACFTALPNVPKARLEMWAPVFLKALEEVPSAPHQGTV